MKKKLLSTITLLCLTVSSAWAAFTPQSGDTWDSGTKTLTVNLNPGDNAYTYNSEIQHLVIGSGVTSIGEGAFERCSGLLSVTFASDSQLETIGDGAFEGCSRLKSIEIPASVTSIGVQAFKNCERLTTFEIIDTPSNPSQLTSIPDFMLFRSCSLKSITIPASVTSIGNYAFYGCDQLASVTFVSGSQLESIGSDAFTFCYNLTSIEIPASVTSIGNVAFADCLNLAAVYVKNGSATLSESAFDNCPITGIYVPTDQVSTCQSASNWSAYKKWIRGTDVWGSDLWGSNSGDDADHPYVISSTAGLDLLAAKVNAGTDFEGKFFKLGADITYSYDGLLETESNYTPIGETLKKNDDNFSNPFFQGTFDGDNHTISGIRIYKGGSTQKDDYQGLFGSIYGSSTVKQVILFDTKIAGHTSVGGIAGASYGIIEKCQVLSDVIIHAPIASCDSHGGIAGGLGYSSGGTIKDCFSAAVLTSVKGLDYSGECGDVGGIVGMNNTYGSVENCLYIGGKIAGKNTSSGAIAGCNKKTITNCYYTDSEAYPIVKDNKGSISNNSGQAYFITLEGDININADNLIIFTTPAHQEKGTTVAEKSYNVCKFNRTVTLGYNQSAIPEGYDFKGFTVTKDGTNPLESVTVEKDEDKYTFTMPANHVTVATILDPIAYGISYDLAGGTEATANPTTYTVESDAITLVNPTRTGYTFAGWTGTGLTAATKTVTIAKGSTGARSYTATWTVDNYAITYDLAGGTVATSNPMTYTIESDAITLVNPTRTGYTFAGWTGTGLTAATKTVTIAKGSTGARSYTATWTVDTYAISYDLAGGTEATANPTTYTVESNAITLVNPTRTGYTFAGWTGTGLTAATMTVTIAKGSMGAKSYTATWKKLLTNADIKVSAIADQTCTGSALTPAVTVKDGETDITAQCDITYKNNTNVGTATVTITAKASSTAYSGETTTTFSIIEPAVPGDANGDKVVNVADIVKMVNDHASQDDIDAAVKIILGNK